MDLEIKKDLVYCVDCKYFLYGGYESSHNCNSEENKEYEDRWYSRETKYLKHPKEINKHNICKWFKKKD